MANNSTCGPLNLCSENGKCTPLGCKCIGEWDPATFCEIPFSDYYNNIDIGLYMVTVVGCFILSILLTMEIIYDIRKIKNKTCRNLFINNSTISGKIFLFWFVFLRFYVHLSYSIQSITSTVYHPLITEIPSAFAAVGNTLALTLTSVNLLSLIVKAKKMNRIPKFMIYYKQYIYIICFIFIILYLPLFIMIAMYIKKILASILTVIIGGIFLLSLATGMTYYGIKAQKWINKELNGTLAKKLYRKIYWIYVTYVIVFLFLSTFMFGFIWPTSFAGMIIKSVFGFYTVFMWIAFFMLLENHLYNRNGKLILYGMYTYTKTESTHIPSSSKETMEILSSDPNKIKNNDSKN